jgi:alcohol dehydrogenase class IV
MRFNADAAGAKLAAVARALGVEEAAPGPALAALAATAVAELLARIGHPVRLSDLDIGVGVEDLPRCAELALGDGATATNPRGLQRAEEIVAVYRQAM